MEVNICVCGWYFYQEIYCALNECGHNVTVVANRDIPCDIFDACENMGFHERPNIALEFGAYQEYLDKYWPGGDTLFMHDDIKISDSTVFDSISELKHDQAFIFKNEFEGKCNQNFHGRAVFCSHRFLRLMREYVCDCKQSRDYIDDYHNRCCSEECARKNLHTGWDAEQRYEFVKDDKQRTYRCPVCSKTCTGDYWGMWLRGVTPHGAFFIDPWNQGHSRGKPPVGVRHYNEGIYHYATFCSHAREPGMAGVKYDSRNVVYYPEISSGKRGVIK
jgi:hypothetical protein